MSEPGAKSVPPQAGDGQAVAKAPASAVESAARAAMTPMRHPGDYEFLPAALEILETPPSPIRISLLLTICALVVVALAWSWFGHIDIVAVAQGKLQPTGRVKIVQPVENGKVKTLRAQNGLKVREGDILIELDPTEAAADVDATRALLLSTRAEVARRRAAATVGPTRVIEPAPSIEWPADTPEDVRTRERRVLESDLRQLAATIASLEAQRRQKDAERQRVLATVAAQTDYVKTLQERVDMRRILVERDAGSRASLIDALDKLGEQQTQLALQRGQLNEAEASLAFIAREIERTLQGFEADNSQKLIQAERAIEDYEQRYAKARIRLENTFLRAPIDGVVQALSVLNTGQVVAAGEQLMRVVPAGVGLEIEAYALNKDIGFIKEGQEAVVKIESFPFTRYGTISAKVTKVATDAISTPDIQQLEGNPASAAKPAPGGVQRTQNLVFPVTLEPEQTSIMVEGVRVPLSAGMTVNVEIKTGQRRIIEYIFSPLTAIGSQALRER